MNDSKGEKAFWMAVGLLVIAYWIYTQYVVDCQQYIQFLANAGLSIKSAPARCFVD